MALAPILVSSGQQWELSRYAKEEKFGFAAKKFAA